jgi:hypothetical protein
MVGHIFPVWLGFKGGKGIATSGGIMIGLFPGWVFHAALWSGRFFYAMRYVSVASIAAAISLPVSSGILMLFGRCDWRLVIIAALMCALAIWRHKSNIERLLAGTEKIREKALRLKSLSRSYAQEDQCNRRRWLGNGPGPTPAENRAQVRLWAHNPSIAEELVSRRTNETYCPECVCPQMFIPEILRMHWMPNSHSLSPPRKQSETWQPSLPH